MCVTRIFPSSALAENTSMPQLTAQYGQMVRASLVCASLYGRMAAACAASMSANPNAPSVVPAKPALAPTKKWRRESSMFMRPVLHQNVLPPPGDVQLRTALAARPDQREFRDRLQGKFGEYAESN